MRDWRTDEQRVIDRELLNLLSDLHSLLEADAPFHLISGYRSPKTNAMLARKSGGVAKKSMHLKGMAADIALPDRSLIHLHKAAVDMKRGGVGLYRRTGFVHVDTGRIRYW